MAPRWTGTTPREKGGRPRSLRAPSSCLRGGSQVGSLPARCRAEACFDVSDLGQKELAGCQCSTRLGALPAPEISMFRRSARKVGNFTGRRAVRAAYTTGASHRHALATAVRGAPGGRSPNCDVTLEMLVKVNFCWLENR